MSVTVTAAGLADELKRVAERVPRAVARAMVNAAYVLKNGLVPRAMATARPPIDLGGSYANGWQISAIEGGAAVGNPWPEAVDIERGLAPQPAQGGGATAGVEPRWILKRSIEGLREEMPLLLELAIKEERP